jgi:hypothetical protein
MRSLTSLSLQCLPSLASIFTAMDRNSSDLVGGHATVADKNEVANVGVGRARSGAFQARLLGACWTCDLIVALHRTEILGATTHTPKYCPSYKSIKQP